METQNPVTNERAIKIARVAHMINDAYRAATGETPRGPFEQQSDDMKQGAILGVVQHLMNEHGISPRVAHDLWMENKLKNGWRFGDVFNAETKEHNCLLPYDCLPESQRVKDHLFSAVVEALRDWE